MSNLLSLIRYQISSKILDNQTFLPAVELNNLLKEAFLIHELFQLSIKPGWIKITIPEFLLL